MTKNTKPKLDDFDDDFDKLDGPSGGDMAQYQTYKAFNVLEKNVELENSAKKLIISLCNVYLERGMVSNEDYVTAIGLAEQQNLFVLLKQVKYSEHILDSLMLQLDAGGFIDKDIYSTIREMQKSAMQITLEVSKFTRTLPEYLKYVQSDIDKIQTSTDILIMSAEQKNDQFSIEASTNSSSEFTMSGPIRGTREIMLHMSDVRADIANAIERATDIIPTPIVIDDEPYESLDEDLDEDE